MDDSQIKQPEQEEDKSPGLRKRQAISALASIAFHALAIAAIAYFVVPGAGPRTQWLVIHLAGPRAGVASHRSSAGGDAMIARLEGGELHLSKARHHKVNHHVASVRRHRVKRSARKKRIEHRPVARKRIVRRMKTRSPKARLQASKTPENPGREASATKPKSPPAAKHLADASSGRVPSRVRRPLGKADTDPSAAGISVASPVVGAAGWSNAHARYGENPAPRYPREARLLDEQGTVLLRVEVAPDGSVKRVEIAHSSGFDLLDKAALETVSERWRFVPARRNGVAVQSWVRVPIRFALKEASADF